MKLIELSRGESAKIVKIEKNGIVKKRLLDLGITTKETIKFERKAPLGDPQQYTVKDTSIAIRSSDAKFIEIKKI